LPCTPGYPAYRNILSALGCQVVDLPCGAEVGFQPTVQMLEALDEPIKGLVVASPANPTGNRAQRQGTGQDRHLVRGQRGAAGQRQIYTGSATANSWTAHGRPRARRSW